jgi:hypothetical protein
MEYIIKDEKLELKYQKGKGAWTYHLRIIKILKGNGVT